MFVLVVPKAYAEAAKEVLVSAFLLDKSKSVVQTGGHVEFPLMRELDRDEVLHMLPPGPAETARCEKVYEDRTRPRMQDPIVNIRAELVDKGMSEQEAGLAPEKWEMLGDVVVIKVPRVLEQRRDMLAAAYARELQAKSVLEEYDHIQGELRVPQMRLLFGSLTETVHKENGILYELDAARVMFSSGNVDERIRMARFGPLEEEVIVDMFAGIGYFTLPLAVYSRPGRIYACEKNEVSYRYLKRNIGRNKVWDRVEPLLGDNREVGPVGVADRVVMGYVGSTHEFLPRALEFLKPSGGVIHYHETCPNELLPRRPAERLEEACRAAGRGLAEHRLRRIKSYAPGVTHVVVDAVVR